MRNFVFTSESVTEGHPDKVADRISDAILDAYLEEDRKNNRNPKEFSKVAVETVVFTGGCLLVGQVTSKSSLNIPLIVRETIKEIGYDINWGYDPEYIGVIVSIDPQSPDIAQGVNDPKDIGINKREIKIEYKDYDFGAGDQGIMFGFACNETKSLMPAPILLAHRLAYRLAEVRKKNILDFLGPDGKTQVTIHYEDNKPVFLKDIVISSQHKENIKDRDLWEGIKSEVIKPVLKEFIEENELNKSFFDENKTVIYINPTGRFVMGGPRADTGLTGRKVIVDTYGGYAHGGGSFSGKDPTKVDRSATYMARYIAKNIVKANLAKKVEIQLAYVIGQREPVSIYINTFNTSKVDENKIIEAIKELCDLTPGGIIKSLNLFNIKYKPLSAYGHFGRKDLDLPWEKEDLSEKLAELLKVKNSI